MTSGIIFSFFKPIDLLLVEHFITEHSMHLEVDKKSVVKSLINLVRKRFEEENVIYWMSAGGCRAVVIGERNISSDICRVCGNLGLMHMAIKITENHPLHGSGVWSEVMF